MSVLTSPSAPNTREYAFGPIVDDSNISATADVAANRDVIECPPVDGSEPSTLRHDVLRSVGNGAKLGLSLIGTWAIGLGVRVFMPRHLGPAAFGAYQFADAFTYTLFIVTGLGVDSYIQKEIPTRPEHASDFFGGVLGLRLALSVVMMVAGVAALAHGGKTQEVRDLVVLLGIAQILTNLSYTCNLMSQAVGEVDGQSVLNVVGKLAWALGVAAALWFGAGVRGVALATLATEALKLAGYARLARRHVRVRLQVDLAATRRVVRASLPFLLSAMAQAVYCRVDVSVMSFLTNDMEVGYYGAAGTLAGMSLLLAPLLGWVLGPLTSRAAARSHDELMLVTRRATEAILAVAIPASLLLFLGAGPIVRLAFGPAYAPAAHSLRLLAPTFVLTYLAMVSCTVLVRLERAWTVTWVAVVGMALSPILNLWLVPAGLRMFGRGGAGVGAGTALVATEAFTAGAMLVLIGRTGIDRRLVIALGKTIVVCAAVGIAHWLLAPLGAWRLAVDGLLYVGGVAATRAVRFHEVVELARGLLAARRNAPGSAPTAVTAT